MKKLLEVNLIAERLIKRKQTLKVLRYIRRGYAVCVLVFLGFLLIMAAVGMEIARCRAKTLSLKNNIKAERKEYGIEQLENEWKDYVTKMGQIENNLVKRTNIAVMMSELSKALPENAIVKSFSADTNNGVSVRLDLLVSDKGQLSMESVIGLLDNLKKNPVFGEHVKVDSQEKANSSDRDVSGEIYKISVLRKQ